MVKAKILSKLAWIASFFSLTVISLGAFTRLIDAGLGCPDWPGCYGQLAVPMSEKARQLLAVDYPHAYIDIYKAWAEMIHRYFAGTLSILILAIIVLTFQKEVRTQKNLALAGGLLLLIVYQIILGQWTVTHKLEPFIVTQHLLGGFLILSLLWLYYLNNAKARQIILETPSSLYNQTKAAALRGLLPWGVIALFLLFLQITLGAWTSTHYASLSCPGFPFCVNAASANTALNFKEGFAVFAPINTNYEGGILSVGARQAIHMAHRLGALIFTTYMIIFVMLAMSRLKRSFKLLQLVYVLMGLLSIQLCIGIANVVFKLPLIAAISHNLVAVLLLLSLITFQYTLTTIVRKGVRV